MNVNYSSIGSGKGIAAITARTVDFGASDAPLTPDQATACKGCVQVPWALAGTGPVENIPGVNGLQLKLTGALLAKIYLGQITNWNDPAIAKINPKLNLPNKTITVVHRSDGSGDYLRLHRLPVQGQQDLGVEGRQRDDRQLARRASAATGTPACRRL